MRGRRTAYAALWWIVIFLAIHIYWYLGGSFGSPGALPGLPHDAGGWVFTVAVAGAFPVGMLVCLAAARGWRFRRTVRVLAGLGAAVLLLRGGAGVVDDVTRITGLLPDGITGLSIEETTGTTATSALWAGYAIDAYFLLGGILFTRLTLRAFKDPDDLARMPQISSAMSE